MEQDSSNSILKFISINIAGILQWKVRILKLTVVEIEPRLVGMIQHPAQKFNQIQYTKVKLVSFILYGMSRIFPLN